jgi:hypothetical protein
MKSFKYALTPIISLFIFCGLIVSSPLSAKPPESSGPYVSRYEDYSFWTYWANGMIVFVGADIPAICQGNFLLGLWDYKEIESPADIDLIMSVSKGDDIPTFVYPDSIYWNDPCAYGDENLWIVSGTSDAICTVCSFHKMVTPSVSVAAFIASSRTTRIPQRPGRSARIGSV